MLLEEACRVTTDPVPHELGRYMLLDFRIRPEARTALAGVTHVNGTARIQTLAHRAENPFVYDLLTHVRETYGLTALINTSFNSAGEPIVHTPGQAVQSALNMNLNGLVLNQEFYPDTAFNDLIQRYADALPLG
jgi:carbamoyltransferase